MISEYSYKVSMVTEYLVISLSVTVELDEHTGNLSPEAGLLAVKQADSTIEYELGKSNVSDLADDIEVTLLLDDDEITLDEIAEKVSA